MEYKDTILPNEEEFKTLKNGYIMAQNNSLNDLDEIYKKMLDEKEYLLSQNIASTHPKLLKNLEKSIASMKAILHTSNKENHEQKGNKNPFSAYRFKTASNNNLANDDVLESDQQSDSTLEQNGQNEPSEDEKKEVLDNATQVDETASEDNDTTLPNENSEQGDTQLDNNTNSRATQQANRQNRGRPFRQNPIAKAFSNFPINFDKIRKQNDKTVSQNQRPTFPPCNTPNCEPVRPPFPPQNPPFPPMPPQNGCEPHRKMVTKELDIIRLLLLYMALRPNCPYTYRLCTIAQTHLEILGEMLE